MHIKLCCDLRRCKHTLWRLKISVVNLEASYHARRLITWVISVRSKGRTKCFFPSEVRKRILAKAGTTSLVKLTLSSTTPWITTWTIKKADKEKFQDSIKKFQIFVPNDWNKRGIEKEGGCTHIERIQWCLDSLCSL